MENDINELNEISDDLSRGSRNMIIASVGDISTAGIMSARKAGCEVIMIGGKENTTPPPLATINGDGGNKIVDFGGASLVAKPFINEKQLVDINGVMVPSEKLEAFRNYAQKLRHKYPTMTPNRLQRKVAEYFKLKMV